MGLIKVSLFLALFLFLAFSADAAWEQFQFDDVNSGKAEGIGYLYDVALTNRTNLDYGSNKQPLVSDINIDGENEIVIFSKGRLNIFDSNLGLIDAIAIGALQGQPALFDTDSDSFKEIIFISNMGSKGYFFVYEYNKGFKQEFNFTVANSCSGSGIKCTLIGSTGVCIFMDNSQYVHTVNMTSQQDKSYMASTYYDAREKIPAIGDLHNNGSLEAVFWFDANGDNEYGLLAFDILNSQPDSGFGDNGIVDDIIRPYSTRFFLKGHPVLVDLNTDGKLEIAVSAFYDDPTSREMYTDWFTELFVYNSTGGKMFSVCETSPSGTCNDGSSETNKWEGTNPFVLDSNKDGFNEICFIKDKKERYYFKSMAINCYNYSGNVILDAELFPATDTVKTATVADMNSDGIMEVITPDGIYDLEGNLVFLYDLDFNFVIPADIDKNNALDLLWAKENQTIVFLDNFSYSYDLAVEEKDIFFQKNNTRITVHNLGNGFIENAEILLLNPNTMENATFFASIRGNGNLTINSNISLSENEQLLVQIDYGNKIEEADEKNNFASKTFEGFPYVFVSAEFEINNLEEEFRDFIKDKLSSGYYTGKEDEASVKVYIGKNNWFNKMKNAFTRFNYGYYYDFGAIYCKDSTAAYPYNGLIGAYKENDIVYILIYGNEIDGDIAAVKEFINHEADFLTIDDEYSFFVGNDNLAAVKVFDFLHNTGNGENYKKDNDAFRQIVRNALRGEMFVDKTYTVETSNNIILQLKNFKPNASSMYLLYLNSSSYDAFMPVVMAGGIWSNISSWAELGGELANNGRDVWLIEITGGHYTECDECINYNYIDLVDDFWPALIAAVEEYTGNNKIQYVAHSNGCRTALDSLTNWSSTGKNNVGTITKDGNTVTISLSADPIDTFVGVACPGNFSELSYFTEKVKNKGAKAIDNFKNKNKNHLNFRDLKEEILDIPFIGGREQISLNLFKQYVEWINLTTDEQPGKNLFIDYFTLIYGTDGLFFAGDNDFIVPITDEVSIYNQINSSNKYLQSVHTWHIGMTKNDKVKNTVKDSLDKSLFPS